MDTQSESFNDGYELGFDLGMDKGKTKGEENLARLIKLLRSDDRNDQVDAVLDDPSRRAELMAEYGIW